MAETILIQNAEHIQFLLQNIQEALGQKVHAKLLLRGSRDGMTHAVFHQLCDNKGPLLSVIKSRKDILCGLFSSVDWKNTGGWTVDQKCFVYSLKLMKIYKRQNDNWNIYFGPGHYGGYFGIDSQGKLYSNSN